MNISAHDHEKRPKLLAPELSLFKKKNYELNFSPGESKKNPARRKTGDKSR
jgi:hypothetical protein